MKKRLFASASLVSAILAGVVLLGWVATFSDAEKPSLTLTPNCHVTISRQDDDSSLTFFSDAQFGPMFNCIPAIKFEDGFIASYMDGRIQWDHLGTFLLYLHKPKSGAEWTFAVSFFDLLLPFTILPAAWALRRWFTFSRAPRELPFLALRKVRLN